MTKLFNFGKVDFNGTGRKINAITIEMELKELDNGEVRLSICGDVWNGSHTDVICGGQCLDEILPFVKNRKCGAVRFSDLFVMWKLYHLNDMHAGTIKQEKMIEEWLKETKKQYEYTEVCNYLESVDLLIDGGYRYGTSWLYRSIPQNDLDKIKIMLND